MKHIVNSILTLFSFSLLSLNLSAQYGPQFENRGFEQWTTREATKAQVKAVVHGDADYKIIADGTEEPADKHVATAVSSFTRTSTANGDYTWRRLSHRVRARQHQREW